MYRYYRALLGLTRWLKLPSSHWILQSQQSEWKRTLEREVVMWTNIWLSEISYFYLRHRRGPLRFYLLGKGKARWFVFSVLPVQTPTLSFIVLMLRKPCLLCQRSLEQSCYADVLRSMAMQIGSCFDQSTCWVTRGLLSPPEPIWYLYSMSVISLIQLNTFSISGWISEADSINRICSSDN